MRSAIFDTQNVPVGSEERYALQNSRMLRVGLGPDVLATKGAMVGYRGNVDFHHEKAGSLAKLGKKLLTGENVSLMRCTGQGEIWFAQEAGYIHLLQLEGDGISINSRNLLAFDAQLQWDIAMIKSAGILAGGLFNTTVGGTGTVAVSVVGKAMLLDCSQQPVYVDPNSAVCWSAALTPGVHKSMHLGSMLRGGSGEAIQFAFHGPGFVIVQSFEWRPAQKEGGGGVINTALDFFT
jgi:uncharacterized protein (AIM24 family)